MASLRMVLRWATYGATFVALAVHADTAFADWQFTQWGMPLRALTDKAREYRMSLEKTTEADKDAESVTVVGPLQGDPKYDPEADLKGEWNRYPGTIVFFLFDRSQTLRMIRMRVPRASCATLRGDLGSELGRPSAETDRGNPGDWIQVEWATRRDRVTFMWSHQLPGSPAVGSVCTAEWRHA
jgi:hypothetical protein